MKVPGSLLGGHSGARCLTTPENVGDGGVWKVGLPWSEEEFLTVADKVGQPFDGPPVLPDGVVRAVFRMVTEGLAKTAQRLASTVAEWTVLAQSQRDGERLTQLKLPAHRRRVLSGKRLELFRTLLERVGHPDASLPDDVAKGFRITGSLPETGVFNKKLAKDVVGEDLCNGSRICHKTSGMR